MSELDLSKKRLQWQCRRGMLELDVLLNRFLQQQYSELTVQQQRDFAALLRVSDTELYAWFMQQATVLPEHQAIITYILDWQRHHAA